MWLSIGGAALIIAHILFVFILPGHLEPAFVFARTWGFHFIAYYSKVCRIFIYALLFLSLLPWVSNHVMNAGRLVYNLLSGQGRKQTIFFVLSLASIPVFIAFKCKYGLLGDNFIRVADIVNNRYIDWHDTGIVFALHYFYLTLHGLFNTGGAQALAISTYICGALYVYFAALIADELGTGPFRKVAIFAALTASGVMQLFFGYLEITPQVYTLLAIHLYAVIRYLKERCSVFFPGLTLAFATFCCLAGLFFVPAFAYAVWSRTAEKKPLLRKPWVIGLSLAFITCLAWYPARRWIIPDCFPLTPQPNNPMAMFSARHFWEYFNGLTLGIGVSVILIPVLLGYSLLKHRAFDGITRFLAVEFLAVAACTFVFNEILGSSDADIYSFPGIIGPLFAMSALLVLFDKQPMHHAARQGAFIFVLFMLMHTTLYIGINASEKSIKRYEDILLTDPASYYIGHPAPLTMSIAYADNGLVSQQIKIARKGCTLYSEDARMYNSLANGLIEADMIDSAFTIYDQIYDKFPDYIFPFKLMYQAYRRREKMKRPEQCLNGYTEFT